MTTFEVLRLNAVHKQYGPQIVLDDAHLSMNYGDRIALVGENGAGKTTLARLIMGEENPTYGDIWVAPTATVGYLPQEVTDSDHLTVGQIIARMNSALDQLAARLAQLEAQISYAGPSELTNLLEEYSACQNEFIQQGGYAWEARLARVLDSLGIGHLEQNRLLGTLSGGEKVRTALAALLLREPDLLILDEPTNHLDSKGLVWLEDYLHHYPHALLLISHDRAFINNIVNGIAELSPTHRLKRYHGNYDDYLRQREAAYRTELAIYEARRDEMIYLRRLIKTTANNPRKTPSRPDNDKFIYNDNRAQAERTASKSIRDAKQRLITLEGQPLENPKRNWRIAFDFAPQSLMSVEPIRLNGLYKRYGEQTLFSDLSAVIRKGQRVVLVAPNGSGKTTLLLAILGDVELDAGNIAIAPSVKLGYLDQEGLMIDAGMSVLSAFREDAKGTDKDLLAQLHRNGLFTDPSLASKLVGDLSAGQRRKLALAKLIASGANVLLLDEPTNHLDFVSLEALEDALRRFEGALLAISHDRRFIVRVATHIWQLIDGRIVSEAVSPQ